MLITIEILVLCRCCNKAILVQSTHLFLGDWLVGWFFFFNALPPGTPGDLKANCMAHGTVDEEWLTLKVVNWL